MGPHFASELLIEGFKEFCDHLGNIFWGDTRSLDYSSYAVSAVINGGSELACNMKHRAKVLLPVSGSSREASTIAE